MTANLESGSRSPSLMLKKNKKKKRRCFGKILMMWCWRVFVSVTLLALGAATVGAYRGRAGPPEDIAPPVPNSPVIGIPECPDIDGNSIIEKLTTPRPRKISPTTPPPVPTTTPRTSITARPNVVVPVKPVKGAPGTGSASSCPPAQKFGPGPDASCSEPRDPLNKPASPIEKWFTRDIFYDLFPFANLGWGPHACFPYSYEAFVIAARYFPQFGADSTNTNFTAEQNYKRDLAAFFAHAVQETGENNAGLYGTGKPLDEIANCFYRGGFFNWFEGGPVSSFLDPKSPGYSPRDGQECRKGGEYCARSSELDYWFGCKQGPGTKANMTTGCYLGRGAIQISYNYNYGMFQNWLASQGIKVDLLANPNLVMTKADPPLAIMASLWFYMTPQPPKPAMHDIMMGNWNSGDANRAAGYTGPMFGPTSLIINNECNGEDAAEPGGGGESRRIKAFKWFCKYFAVPVGPQRDLSCKDMPVKLDMIKHNQSWQPDWSSTWKAEPCKCAPASYGGMVPYFDPAFYPARFVALNAANKARCEASLYDNPKMYSLDPATTACLAYKPLG